MTPAEARDLAWQVGGEITSFVVVVVVILVGFAVLGSWRGER